MKNKKLKIDYDKKRDVMYVLFGKRNTLNLPWSTEEEICFDPKKLEVVGYIITNFSHQYPKLAAHTAPKEKWFISDFFAQRLKDWALLLSPFKSKKALLDFLTQEHSKRSPHLARL